MEPWVEEQLRSVPGHIGFWYKDLVTGETHAFNARETFQAASVIKLPILCSVFLRAEEDPGVLDQRVLVREEEKLPGCGALQHISGAHEYDVLSLCRLMITISDNTATNALIRHFGMEALNGDFRRLGLEETRIYRLLFDAEASRMGKENLFQPEELGSLLEKIYRKELVSPRGSEQIADILLRQQINHKIPGCLPPDLRVAHKTGEDDGITNDLGIVYEREPFVLVFASNETDVPAFEQVIRAVSYYYAKGRK